MNCTAEDLIRSNISANGPISFEEFMEIALYSEVGYYRTKDVFGTSGDYYTSPHLHPIFGSLVALQMEKMWKCMGSPAPFYLIEQGAGDATLATDVLETIALLDPAFYSAVSYLCVDRRKIEVADGVPAQFLQSDRLGNFQQAGVILSNELIDSFPVKMIEIIEGEVFEIFVDVDHSGNFDEIRLPIDKSQIENILPKELEELNGYRGPLNTRVNDWYANISKVLSHGFLVTIDYGYSRNIYYSMEKSHRLLQTYYKHTEGSSPYQRIGSQDLTAHVDFDSLREIGVIYGFKELEYCSQSEWLLRLGLEDVLENMRQSRYESPKAINLISSLADESGLGSFKVLIQGKNLDIAADVGLKSKISWPSDLNYPCVRETHMAYASEASKTPGATFL